MAKDYTDYDPQGTYGDPNPWANFTWDDFIGPTVKETFLKYGVLPDTRTEEEKVKDKEQADKVKSLWPLLLIPLATWLYSKRNKQDNIMESIDSVALVNFLTGYQDYIMGALWAITSRFSPTLQNLSLTLVGAETIPTLDLNLPKGVMLGSWLAVGDYAVGFVANTKKDVGDLIETGKTSETTGPLDILIASILTVTGLDK